MLSDPTQKYKELLAKTQRYYKQISKTFNVKLDKFDSIEVYYMFNKKWSKLTKKQEKCFLSAYKKTLDTRVRSSKNIPSIFKNKMLNKNNNNNNNNIVFGNFNNVECLLWEMFIQYITGEKEIESEDLLNFIIELFINLVNDYNYLKFYIIPKNSTYEELKLSDVLSHQDSLSEYLDNYEIKIAGVILNQDLLNFIQKHNKLIINQYFLQII